MRKRESIVARMMNFMVSGYVYFVALMLVIFMVAMLVTGVFGIVLNIIDIVFSPTGFIFTPDVKDLEFQLLHTIAFTIVLVKAYKILISYAETQFINIKFLVEIAIIAPTIELLFNSRQYPLEINILFASFAFFSLLAYLYFYQTLKAVSDDYDRDHCAPEAAPPEPKAAAPARAPARQKKKTAAASKKKA